MSLRIEETFQLRAPADRVWGYLADPRRVVDCLPGAELTDVRDESTFLGRVRVKIGPVTAAYSGTVTITARDDVAHVISMVGEGREATGSGAAKMTMTSRIATLPSGDTEVRVTAEVDIVGKAAQFGRGMIESVNKQLFRQFTACVKGTLETAGPVEAVTPIDAAASPGPTLVAPPDAPAPGTAQPVRIIPLLLRALGEMLARVARSLLGLVRRPARR
jgi:carbon monoxide dehydrogenase subunit G